MGLFGLTRRETPTDSLENVIGRSTSLHGIIKSDGGARIEGRFEGRIEVAGNVVVGEEGIVVGDIFARDVTIGGTVEGNIEGAGRLEILTSGKVFGDVTAAAIMIDEGGLFEGISRMRGAARKALPAPMAPAPVVDDVVIDLKRRSDGVKRTDGTKNGKANGKAAHQPDVETGDVILDLGATVASPTKPTTSTTSTTSTDRSAADTPTTVAKAAPTAAPASSSSSSSSSSSLPASPEPSPSAADRSDHGLASNIDAATESVASTVPVSPTATTNTSTDAAAAQPAAGKASTKAAAPRISRAAAQLCEQQDLDPHAITGTGSGGLITKLDVRRAIAARKNGARKNGTGASSNAPSVARTTDDRPADKGGNADDEIQIDIAPDAGRAPKTLDFSALNIEAVIPDTSQTARTVDSDDADASKEASKASSSNATSSRAAKRSSNDATRRKRR